MKSDSTLMNMANKMVLMCGWDNSPTSTGINPPHEHSISGARLQEKYLQADFDDVKVSSF